MLPIECKKELFELTNFPNEIINSLNPPIIPDSSYLILLLSLAAIMLLFIIVLLTVKKSDFKFIFSKKSKQITPRSNYSVYKEQGLYTSYH